MNIFDKFIKSSFVSLLAILVLASCGDDEPVEPPHEEELITTLNVIFTPETGSAVTLKYYDEDGGDGPKNPQVTGGTLAANTSYTVTLELLNESESPAEDITEEIEKEAEEHQFFFVVSANLNLTHSAYTDKDANQKPIGLENTFTTGDASSGTLKVILRHEPNKAAEGVASGDITNAGGETDIETVPEFAITIAD